MDMSNALLRVLCAIALTGIASSVQANCGSIINDYIAAATPAEAGDIILSSPECFGGGPTTAQVQMNGAMFQQALAISRVLVTRHLADGPAATAAVDVRGMAAGSKLGAFNTWANLGDAESSQGYATPNDYAGDTGYARNEMGILNAIVGLDYPVSPAMVVGLSLALDRGDGKGGNLSTDYVFDINDLNSHGFVLAPYLGWQISKELAFDASIGLGRGHLKTSLAEAYRNELDSSRWYAAANLNYERWQGNLQFTGRASLLHGVERYGNINVQSLGDSSITETGSLAGTGARNTIDEFRLAAQAGYWMNGVMPYIGIGYTNDFRRETTQYGEFSNPIGSTAWEWRLGANFYSKASGLTGGIAYAQEAGRTHQKSHTLVANINLRF
jgi:hypothetical protein